MKRFLSILLILMFLPICCFAAKSPTIDATTHSKPNVIVAQAENQEEWSIIVKRLSEILEETKGYILLDAFQIYLDTNYEKIEWHLTKLIDETDAPFVLLIDPENISKYEVEITKDGTVITDFSQVEPGLYFILFFISAGI